MENSKTETKMETETETKTARFWSFGEFPVTIRNASDRNKNGNGSSNENVETAKKVEFRGVSSNYEPE